MKKNKMMRLASVLLIAVLMSTCAISGTFAKYVSEGKAEATATIAKWSITVDGQDVVVDDSTATFNLDATVTDYNGSTEDDVAEMRLAPGTAGSFSFIIKNESDVTAKYSIEFAESIVGDLPDGVTAEDFPVEYSLDRNGTDDDWTTELEDLEVSDTNLNMNTENTITIFWRWKFQRGDDDDGSADDANAIDTAFGTAETKVTITATIFVEQID